MDGAELREILSHASLTAGMDAAAVEELLASSKVRRKRYACGEMVFMEGDTPKAIYILLSGEVHIYKDAFSGRQIFLSEIDVAGDMFGEVYAMLGKPYDLSVECARAAEVLEISSALFSLQVVQNSRAVFILQRNLTRILARKAYAMNQKLKILGSGSLREKIVRYIHPLLKEGHVCLAMTREQLAAYLAVTRPALSREISNMVREGIFAVEGKSIRVGDMERFEAYL